MARIFQLLLALIATGTERELAKYVEFLKYENKILRARIPGQVHTKPDERRRLVQLGKALGLGVESLLTIVSVSTFYRWCRDEKAGKKKKHPKGGQRKPREIREFVLEIAKLTGFGYTRIFGEMRKLGIKGISRQTVRNILKEERIIPALDRTSDKWENFLEHHQNTLWAADFFSVKSVTMRGIQDLYVLVFLCVHSREVIVTSSTKRPNSAWVKKQTEMFIERTKDRKEKSDIVIHDRGTKFTKEFVAPLKAKVIQTNALPVAPPHLNGRVERFIQTIKYERLHKFILFGQRHLDHIAGQWVDYYNKTRSHVERDHLPPIREAPEEVPKLSRDQIVIRSYVSSLVKWFERTAV
jgi:putative transposase